MEQRRLRLNGKTQDLANAVLKDRLALAGLGARQIRSSEQSRVTRIPALVRIRGPKLPSLVLLGIIGNAVALLALAALFEQHLRLSLKFAFRFLQVLWSRDRNCWIRINAEHGRSRFRLSDVLSE
jgi:hypothetical protein